ncbi:MAG: sugar phosphate isomerase/epimerase family protein [Litorivicinaceae bacterium]
MSHKFSLAFLTVKDISPIDMVKIAADTGYDCVGLRLLPAGTDGPYSLSNDRSEQRNVLSALNDTGIQVADAEVVRIGKSFNLEALMPFLEVCSYLGAKHVLVVGDDLNRARLIDNYGIFLEHAAQYGLTGDLEFMPWTAVKTSTDCLEILRAVNKSNAGLLVDALHWERSDRSIHSLTQIPDYLVNYIQLCDAPRLESPTTEQLIHAARSDRLVPGSGDIDLVGMLSALPQGKVYSIEVPRDAESPRLSPRERAKEALISAKSVVAHLDSSRQVG